MEMFFKNTLFRHCNLKGARFNMDKASSLIKCNVEDSIIKIERKQTFRIDQYRTISIIQGELIFHDFIEEKEFKV